MDTLTLMRQALDSCNSAAAAPKKKEAFDSTGGELQGADEYTARDVAVKAAATIQQWCEEDDLDDGETAADRLMMMMVGIADANHDGEIGDDEQAVLDLALNSAWDYLAAKGVTEDDLDLLLNEWDADAADRIRDFVCGVLPDGDEAAGADIDGFVFGGDAETPVFDAVYKKTFSFRSGKKVRVNKRISGHVKLSPRQKVAIRKAQMKSHSAGAVMRRMKSMRMRRKSGL